jgi:hypothetical protein
MKDVRRRVGLEEKAMFLSEKNGIVAQPTLDSPPERHYAVREVAGILNLSDDKVRRMFQEEPGVLVIGDQTTKSKRRYTTLRIPESVLKRVVRRLSKV